MRFTVTQPVVMGVINRSPNSFFNPLHNDDAALCDVERMVHDGAAWVDIGGEATNPAVDLEQAAPSVEEEMDRVLPLLEKVKARFDVRVSIDTSQPTLMRAAIKLGADMINDQRALTAPGALAAISDSGVAVCLMHAFETLREPESSSREALLASIKNILLQAANRCIDAGVARERIVIDPGFGGGHYGKSTRENFYILKHLRDLTALGFPILAGWSRKSMIGDVLNAPVDQRLIGSVAAAVMAANEGASILRVHDVKETVEALKIREAVVNAEEL